MSKGWLGLEPGTDSVNSSGSAMVAMKYATGVMRMVETMSWILRQGSISAMMRAGFRSVAMKVVAMHTKMPAALRGGKWTQGGKLQQRARGSVETARGAF